MASLLLGRRSARATGRDLVRWCDLFGITPGTARVALHRMTAAGELGRDDDGAYVLLGGLARRQREQEASLVPRRRAWRGGWRMAVTGVDTRPAPLRAETRVVLRRLRLAEWREGVWIRPDNLELPVVANCEWLDVRPDADAVRLAAHLFVPARWRSEADRLLTALRTATDRLAAEREAALAPAFLAGAAALRHVRADPLLPDELVPAPWSGGDLRTTYVTYQREFAAVARDWFAGQAGS